MKKPKVDTPFKNSWADTVNKIPLIGGPVPIRMVFNQKPHEYASPLKTGISMTLQQYRKSIGMG